MPCPESGPSDAHPYQLLSLHTPSVSSQNCGDKSGLGNGNKAQPCRPLCFGPVSQWCWAAAAPELCVPAILPDACCCGSPWRHSPPGVCSQLREKFPERVPFRLTRMMVQAMEVSGIEGNFRWAHTQCRSTNRDQLTNWIAAPPQHVCSGGLSGRCEAGRISGLWVELWACPSCGVLCRGWCRPDSSAAFRAAPGGYSEGVWKNLLSKPEASLVASIGHGRGCLVTSGVVPVHWQSCSLVRVAEVLTGRTVEASK